MSRDLMSETEVTVLCTLEAVPDLKDSQEARGIGTAM